MGVFNRGPRDGGDRPPFVMRPNIPGLRAIVIGVAVLLGLIILFSLLVRVTFQSLEGTLTETEVNEFSARILAALEQELSSTLRAS